MTVPKIRLNVDIVSPFAYIAFHVLRTSPVFAKCSITYVPIPLGGLMKQCNNEAPINIRNKDKWIYKERIQLARRFSVPMATSYPESFPPKTVNIQRALCAISQRFPEKLEAAIDALYRTLWAENNGKIGQVEVLKPLLDDLLGVNNSQQILDVR
ncbi:Glutathione S-transferase kappa 1 [Trichoderma lentiforme]|uniref:Glutathione S-transferase kappa 1 n=1 Tax=Trichoderma lentiforme TaxID=1567552 RepID=A0A9P4XR25_9HYPO|nr:Glutathione S-transferase kappa 1 [Trichoderma lentiforme]